jgi:hypothetical protein
MIDEKRWPAWCNGPNGETEIFNSPDELPKGWMHPKLKTDKPQLDHDGNGKAGGAKKATKPPLDL